MDACPYCGSDTVRLSRSPIGKLHSSAAFGCTSCGRSVSIRRRWLGIFQRYVECPRCGTRKLQRIRSRDYVDKMSRNLLRKSLRLLGYPLYHCIFCRYQFRDWRKRESDEAVRP